MQCTLSLTTGKQNKHNTSVQKTDSITKHKSFYWVYPYLSNGMDELDGSCTIDQCKACSVFGSENC